MVARILSAARTSRVTFEAEIAVRPTGSEAEEILRLVLHKGVQPRIVSVAGVDGPPSVEALEVLRKPWAVRAIAEEVERRARLSS